jgi:hypothetical protein
MASAMQMFDFESRYRPCSTSNPNRLILIQMENSVAESEADLTFSTDKVALSFLIF